MSYNSFLNLLQNNFQLLWHRQQSMTEHSPSAPLWEVSHSRYLLRASSTNNKTFAARPYRLARSAKWCVSAYWYRHFRNATFTFLEWAQNSEYFELLISFLGQKLTILANYKKTLFKEIQSFKKLGFLKIVNLKPKVSVKSSKRCKFHCDSENVSVAVVARRCQKILLDEKFPFWWPGRPGCARGKGVIIDWS